MGKSLIQEALALWLVLELVEEFHEAGTCRLCFGAAAHGEHGGGSSSCPWAGGCVLPWAQLLQGPLHFGDPSDRRAASCLNIPKLLSYSDSLRMKPV